VNARFGPGPALRGRVDAPPDKSLSHRAALLGAMSDEPVRIRGYLDAADTNSTLDACRQLGALVEVRRDELVVAVSACARRARSRTRSTSATPDAHAPPAGLAGLPGGPRLDARRGRVDPQAPRRPHRRAAAAHGRDRRRRRGPFPAVHRLRRAAAAIAYDLPVASAQVKSCVLLAGWPPTGRRPCASRRRAATTPSGCSPRRGDDPPQRPAITVGNADELELEDITIPGDPSSAAFMVAAGCSCPARAGRAHVGVNWTRTGFFRIVERMGGIVVGDSRQPTGDDIPTSEPITELDVTAGPLVGPSSRPTRCRWPSTSCRSSRCSAASPRARPSCAARRSCGSRSPTASPRSSRACAGWAPTSRRPATASS
jgi:3-phosphoshikimate 1-carboxyvinyltransferase